VKRGDSHELTTTPGPHELHFALDWCRSKKVMLDVRDGEDLQVRCWPNVIPLTDLYWMTLGRSRYIGLEVVGSDASDRSE